MLRVKHKTIRNTTLSPLIPTLLFSILFASACAQENAHSKETTATTDIIQLPAPVLKSDYSIEEALQSRRSVRRFSDEAVDLTVVSQILWSAQGITQEQRGFRTSPSAGATFPLEIFVAAGNVEGLNAGLYHYKPHEHSLVLLKENDLRQQLSSASLRQTSVRDGAFVVIIAAVFERTTGRYGDRGIKYVHMEVGHVGQNIHLQAESLGLGTVVIGAFNDADVKKVLNLPDNMETLYLMPVGKK